MNVNSASDPTGRFCFSCGEEPLFASRVICVECSWESLLNDSIYHVVCTNCRRRFEAARWVKSVNAPNQFEPKYRSSECLNPENLAALRLMGSA